MELISLALHCACTSLDEEGTRRHVRAALDAGATRDEILRVFKCGFGTAVHSFSLGAPILLEEMKAAGVKAAGGPKPETPACDAMRAIGQWNTAWVPSPELPGFVGRTSLSAIPNGPACLSRVASRSKLQSPLGLPVLRMVPFACMPSPLPRQVAWNLIARAIPSASAFPRTVAGRLLHHCFRGLLSVHSRYGLHARQIAFAILYTRGFSSLVASTAALIATGWSEPVPGRIYPRCGPAPFHGAHDKRINHASANPAVLGATKM